MSDVTEGIEAMDGPRPDLDGVLWALRAPEESAVVAFDGLPAELVDNFLSDDAQISERSRDALEAYTRGDDLLIDLWRLLQATRLAADEAGPWPANAHLPPPLPSPDSDQGAALWEEAKRQIGDYRTWQEEQRRLREPESPILHFYRAVRRHKGKLATAASILMACVFAGLWLYEKNSPPLIVTNSPPGPPAFELALLAPEGTGRGDPGVLPMLDARTQFDVSARVFTPSKHGWLFEINVNEARFLTRLQRQEDRWLAGRKHAHLNATNGRELFVVVVSDEDPDDLGSEEAPVVNWLNDEQLVQLQAAASDAEATTILRDVLKNRMDGKPFELKIARYLLR